MYTLIEMKTTGSSQNHTSPQIFLRTTPLHRRGEIICFTLDVTQGGNSVVKITSWC